MKFHVEFPPKPGPEVLPSILDPVDYSSGYAVITLVLDDTWKWYDVSNLVGISAAALLKLPVPAGAWYRVFISDGNVVRRSTTEVFLFNGHAVHAWLSRRRCAQCDMAFMAHADGSCLYEPTTFKSATEDPASAFNLQFEKRVSVPKLESLWGVLLSEAAWPLTTLATLVTS